MEDRIEKVAKFLLAETVEQKNIITRLQNIKKFLSSNGVKADIVRPKDDYELKVKNQGVNFTVAPLDDQFILTIEYRKVKDVEVDDLIVNSVRDLKSKFKTVKKIGSEVQVIADAKNNRAIGALIKNIVKNLGG